MSTTQKPYLGGFFAAFRAHPPKSIASTPSLPVSAVKASSATIWTAANAQHLSKPSPVPTESCASPRPINPKSNTFSQTSQSSSSTPGATAGLDRQFVSALAPLQHNVSPHTHLPRSPPSPGLASYNTPSTKSQPIYPTAQEARRPRRGSDSSSDSGGFREVRGGGGEKWFIGGLTASGEEKYYKLSMVKRDRSTDRLSTDQMSL